MGFTRESLVNAKCALPIAHKEFGGFMQKSIQKKWFLVLLLAIIVVASFFIGCDEEGSTPPGTPPPAGIGPSAVDLGSAVNYVVLAKTGITTSLISVINGNVGLSPGNQAAMTGFAETNETGYSTSNQVIGGGRLYAADMAAPTPTNLATAITDMEAAYTDAAGRIASAENTDLHASSIGGKTFTPGLYKWTGNVTIGSDMTINGEVNDRWIFQIDGTLTLAEEKRVNVTGGGLPKNIIWVVNGTIVMNKNSHIEGIVLCNTQISLIDHAHMTGRLLSKTRIDLDQATVTQPPL